VAPLRPGEDGRRVAEIEGRRTWLVTLAAVLLAGCGGGAGAASRDAGPELSPTRDPGPPPCVRGIRETACAGAGSVTRPPPDAGAGSGAGGSGASAATLELVSSEGTLAVPLHPELWRQCARLQTLTFGIVSAGASNDLYVFSSLTTVPPFSVSSDGCTGQMLGPGSRCVVQVCLGTQAPGQYSAVATISFGSALPSAGRPGRLAVPLTATVLDPGAGLDAAFGQGGAVLVASGSAPGTSITGATLLGDGATVAIWQTASPRLTFVAPDSKLYAYTADPTQRGFQFAAAAAAPGQGLYALLDVGGSLRLLHFLDDRTRDAGFGDAGALRYGSASPQLLARPPGGAVAVNLDDDVLAFTAGGQLDPTWTVPALLGPVATSTIDSRGRIYAANGTGITRLHADGTVDTGFVFGGPAQAMTLDRDEHLLIAESAAMLLRLDDGGVATPIPLKGLGPVAFADDLDVDAAGRILVAGGGLVLRYTADGSRAEPVAFSDGGARAVMCPPAGGCFVAGTLTPDPAITESFVLRLLP
jgi:hypothetical protein